MKTSVAQLIKDEAVEHRVLSGCIRNEKTKRLALDNGLSIDLFESGSNQAVCTAIINSDPVPENFEPGQGTFNPENGTDDILSELDTLNDLHRQRKLASVGAFVTNSILTHSISTEDAVSSLKTVLLKLESGQNQKGLFATMPESFNDVLSGYREMCQRKSELNALGVPTGYSSLDYLIGGLQPGIHVLAAPPGTGKTTFVLEMSKNISSAGYPVVFVSFEESRERLTMKALCQLGQLDYDAYMKAEADISEIESVIKEKGHKLNSLYILQGNEQTTVSQVKAKMLEAMSETGQKHGVIVVDYLQNWANKTQKPGMDYRLQVGSLLGQLRDLSLDLKIPVLTICSQSRKSYETNSKSLTSKSQNKESLPDNPLYHPQASLSSLKESGDLEYTADTAMFLVPRKTKIDNDPRNISFDSGSQKNKPGTLLYLVVSKNRYGSTGYIKLVFEKNKSHIFEPVV